MADRLHSAAIHLLRRVGRADVQSGVTAAQLSALSVLMSGPKRLGELADAERVRAPTMTRLVQEMERSGLVRREPDPSDARAVRIRWTQRGEHVLRRARDLRLRELTKRIERLAEDDLDVLERSTEVMDRMLRDWSKG